ncbi:MAG: c-type cytochrome domain-containing protein [Mariniblastus sp.]
MYFKLVNSKFLLPIVLVSVAVVSSTVAQEKTEKITYDDHVKQILVARCSSCHNGQKREGDLDVTNYTNLMQGGGSGEVIEPQDSGNSFLYQLITHEDSPEMPPSGVKIPDPQIQMIAKWIDGGALENKGSKAAKAKPKFDMALSESPTAKPEVMPLPLRMPLDPVIKTVRPSVVTIATSPWAPIAAVSAPKQILLYNTQSLELVGVLPMEEGLAHSLRFSRNGQLLLAGGGRDGASGKTILWNVITGERITTVGDELETVLASDISPNHELIALGGPKKLVKIFNTSDGTLVAEINKHTDWVTALEFSPDGKYLATGDRNGGLHVWDAEGGSEVYTLKAHSKSISAISWRSDSLIVASASEDATIRVWEMKKGSQVKGWGAHGNGVTSIEFQRDGHIVSCGRDRVAKVWDQAGKMIRQFGGLTDVAVAVSYCDESKRLLAADWNGQLKVWNGADAKLLGDLSANPPKLAERLASSQQQLNAANQKHVPLAQQVSATKLNLDGIGKALAAAKQTQQQMQAKLTESQKQFEAAKKQFDSTQAQHAQWRTERDAKAKAKPLVKDSHEKAIAAAATLPNDADLKNMVAVLAGKIKQIDERLGELNGLVAKSDQEKKTTKTQMDAFAKSLGLTKSEMEAVSAQVTKLQGEFGTVTEQHKKEAEAANAALVEVQKAKQMVDRWTSDIQFISQLNTLGEQLKTKHQIVEEKQTLVEQAHQKLVEAQRIVDEAKNQKAAIENEANSIKDQIHKLRGGK